MPRILHLLKRADAGEILPVIGAEPRQPGHHLTLVLAQEAISLRPELADDIYVLGEGVAPPNTPYPVIDHARLLELIFENDSTFCY